jgi:hypothetical protein
VGMAISRFDRELRVADSDKALILDYLLKLHWSEHFTVQQEKSKILMDYPLKASLH